MVLTTEHHSTLLGALLTAHIIITIIYECKGNAVQKFPAILVFGDSSVDTGNNNYIPTPLKADHSPYGRDFPGRLPTGRFSNGKLVPDMLASHVGLKETVPPFLDPNLSKADILTGVSFASAGSGYDELTTLVSGSIPVSKQLEYLKDYIRRLDGIVGQKEMTRIMGSALVIVSAGTNDFLFNYYDIPTRSIQFSIDEYQDFVQDKLKYMVKELYRLGCRKMLVAGLPPIGCLPIQRTIKSPLPRNCSDNENEEAQSYNDKLEKLLLETETALPGSKILYVDVYNPIMAMTNNPKKYGFVEAGKGCCGSGLLEAGPYCTESSPMCADPSKYMFYDSIHAGESTYRIVSDKIVQKLPHFNNL